MPEKTAQLLGSRYLLHEPIARGGMAVVWRGTDTRLGRKVAVKVLHARLAGDANFRERFRREAVSAASFNHPNIVTVFDTGESGASHYIVMELVEGPSLSRLLGKTGTLTPGEAVTLLRAVLSGLAYAHERGVVHRDIKPANILLSARAVAGAVKLGDFGIARAHTATDLTATGAIIGTASYLAPEQAEGKPVDHRADLYSLTCLTYRALAGRLPWTADNELGVALARTMRPPAPLEGYAPTVPAKLLEVVAKGLQRNPADRYRSAADMSAALRGMHSEPIRLEPRTEERELRAPLEATPVPAKVNGNANGNGSSAGTARGKRSADRPARESAPARAPRPRARSERDPQHRYPRTGGRAAPTPGPRSQGSPNEPGGPRPPLERPPSGRPARKPPLPVHYRRRRALVVLLAVIILAIVVLFGLRPTHTADQSTLPSPTSEATPLVPVSVKDVDPRPRGDASESPLQTQAVIDGDPATKWSTDKYNSPQDFNGLKDGVGLAFEFDHAVTPHQITTFVTPGTTFEWRTADDGDTSQLQAWTLVPGTDSTADGRAPVEVTSPTGDRTSEYWLLWITGVSRVSGGRGQSSVYEVRFGESG